jgi:DNA-binding transcriptional regulator YhcF (GntR family)
MSVISPSSGSYLYEQVEGMVKTMIDDGVLKVGERVPSIRAMSRKVRVSMATVMQAYLALENKGYVESRPKSGFYVRPRRGPEGRRCPQTAHRRRQTVDPPFRLGGGGHPRRAAAPGGRHRASAQSTGPLRG